MRDIAYRKVVAGALFWMVCLFASPAWAHGWTHEQGAYLILIILGGPSAITMVVFLIATLVILWKFPTPDPRKKVYGIVALVCTILALVVYPGYIYFVIISNFIRSQSLPRWAHVQWGIYFSIPFFVLGWFAISKARELIRRNIIAV